MENDEMIAVEVFYGARQAQELREYQVRNSSTVQEVIKLSMIMARYPEIKNNWPVGIFGKKVSPDHVVEVGDRIEIYRPLEIDPKQARFARVKQQEKNKVKK